MENENIDKSLSNIQNTCINENDIFTLDYENQKIKNNIVFIKWKKSMNNKYKGTKNLYKCPLKNHYFYAEIIDYSILCPSCNEKICPFCYNPIVNSWFAKCCSKRKLYLMHYQGLEFSNPEENKGFFYDYEKEIICFFLPGISLFFLIAIIFNAFFYKIVRKNCNKKDYDLTYENLLGKKSKRILILNMAINGFMSLILLIPFFFFNCGICILLFIFLIIRKKWYKYIIGFFHEDWYFLNKNLKYAKCCHM